MKNINIAISNRGCSGCIKVALIFYQAIVCGQLSCEIPMPAAAAASLILIACRVRIMWQYWITCIWTQPDTAEFKWILSTTNRWLELARFGSMQEREIHLDIRIQRSERFWHEAMLRVKLQLEMNCTLHWMFSNKGLIDEATIKSHRFLVYKLLGCK